MPSGPTNFDHLGLLCPASSVDDEVAFLNAALGPLGIKEQFRIMPLVVAMGDSPQNAFLWVSGLRNREEIKDPVTPIHVAFKAKGSLDPYPPTIIYADRPPSDRAAVDDFHKAGMAAGGKDNGAPGLRKQYHAGYYGAFLISPCGHNVEAVIHEAPDRDAEQ